jgi:DNA-binding transcriptional ArsR family regulator
LPGQRGGGKWASFGMTDHATLMQSLVVWSSAMSLDRFNPKSSMIGLVAPSHAGGDIAKSMADHVEAATGLLKALSHEGRLMILCHLAGGEKSVTELETLLGLRQAAVSQQLARLRLEGLVSTRREGKAIIYAIQDPKVLRLVRALPELFAG